MTRLEEIRARLKAATPGPWEWDGRVWGYDKEQEAPWLNDREGNRILWGEINAHKRDAELISHAPSDLAYLLSLLESSEKEARELKKRNHTLEAIEPIRKLLDESKMMLIGSLKEDIERLTPKPFSHCRLEQEYIMAVVINRSGIDSGEVDMSIPTDRFEHLPVACLLEVVKELDYLKLYTENRLAALADAKLKGVAGEIKP